MKLDTNKMKEDFIGESHFFAKRVDDGVMFCLIQNGMYLFDVVPESEYRLWLERQIKIIGIVPVVFKEAFEEE